MNNKRSININKQLRLHYFLLVGSVMTGPFLYGPEMSSMPLGQWVASCLFIGFISVIPLLIFIPSVLKPSPRSISWFSFFLLAYLVWAILLVFSQNGLWAGLLICTFNLTTFSYCVAWLRPFKKASKEQKAQS